MIYIHLQHVLELLPPTRLENLAASLLPRWHFPMLNDTERNSKFEAAIEAAVQEGGLNITLLINLALPLISLTNPI